MFKLAIGLLVCIIFFALGNSVVTVSSQAESLAIDTIMLPQLATITAENANQLTKLFVLPCDACRQLTWSHDGRKLALRIGIDLGIYTIEAQEVTFRLIDTNSIVEDLSFNSQGTILASAHSGGNVRFARGAYIQLWNVANEDLMTRWYINSVGILGISFSNDSQSIYSSNSAVIQQWDMAGNLLSEINVGVHDYDLFNNNGNILAIFTGNTGDETSEIEVWNLEIEELVRIIPIQNFVPPVNDIQPYRGAFSFDDTLLVFGRSDISDVRFYNLLSPDQVIIWNDGGSIYNLALSPDNQILATEGNDGIISLLDVTDIFTTNGSEPIRIDTLQEGLHQVVDLSFSPSGTFLVSVNLDDTLTFWGIPVGN